MISLRASMTLIAAVSSLIVLEGSRAQAQWWNRAPSDFEECASTAEKLSTKEARISALAECNGKFAGRRKPGGGYTYYDFMQDRNFDIAGPNPTHEEQRHIDEQYTAYLDNQRRNSIVAAFAAKQQQLMQQASLRSEPEQEKLSKPAPDKVPLPHERPRKVQRTTHEIRAHASSQAKPADCVRGTFSCEWPRLSEGFDELKRALFGSPPPPSPSGKAKRG